MAIEEKTEAASMKRKELLFCTLWSLQGRNAFPESLRNEYIKKLKREFPSSKEVLKKKELDSLTKAEDILKRVITFDKDLSKFESIVERYDRLSPKALKLLKTPDFSEDDQKKIQGLKNKAYNSLNVSQDWGIQEVKQVAEIKTTIVLSRHSARVMKAKIRQRDVRKETWTNLEEDVKEFFKDSIESLQNVMVAVAAPYKFQVELEFDWKNKTTGISSDLSEWDEDEGRPGDRQGIRTAALGYIAKELHLKGENTFTNMDTHGEMKDPKLRNKLEKINTKESLVVIRGGLYHIAGTATENEESVRALLRLFEVPKVREAAEIFYAEKGSFTGFFQKNTKFDRARTKIQGTVLKNENPLDCTGIYLRVFDSDGDGVDIYKGTKLEGKEIEVVSFEYQDVSGEWIIRTPNYSGRVRDAFISELNNLSQQPSRHPKPSN